STSALPMSNSARDGAASGPAGSRSVQASAPRAAATTMWTRRSTSGPTPATSAPDQGRERQGQPGRRRAAGGRAAAAASVPHPERRTDRGVVVDQDLGLALLPEDLDGATLGHGRQGVGFTGSP